MTFAQNQFRSNARLLATLLICLFALPACDKPETPAAAREVAESATASSAVQTTQPPGEPSAASAGVLSSEEIGAVLIATAADPVKGPTCNLEMVAGVNAGDAVIEVASGSRMKVRGWIYSAQTQSVPANRYLRVESEDGSAAWTSVLGGQMDRPDVSQWFNIGDWARRSGFDQDIAVDTLVPGRYRLLLSFSENGSVYVCDNGRRISILP